MFVVLHSFCLAVVHSVSLFYAVQILSGIERAVFTIHQKVYSKNECVFPSFKIRALTNPEKRPNSRETTLLCPVPFSPKKSHTGRHTAKQGYPLVVDEGIRSFRG